MSVIIDGLIIFFVLFLIVIEWRRGFFRSLVDLVAVIVATKATRLFLPATSSFLQKFFSENTAGIVGAFLLFIFFGLLAFVIGNIIYQLTLLTIGDPFEDIFAIIFGGCAACGIVHFVLLVAMSFGGDGIKEAIRNSLLGEPLFSFSFYFWAMQKLMPLMQPGDIYL